MSKDMKLIFESWRKEMQEADADDLDFGYSQPEGEEIGMSIDQGKSQASRIEDVSVREFLNFYSDVRVKAEFYDEMDNEINSLLQSHLSTLISAENRPEAAKIIGKSIRAYVGSFSGRLTNEGINNLIKTIIELIGHLLDVGSAKMKIAQKIYDPIGKHLIVPIIGQHIAEYIEEKITDVMGKFDPDELGSVKNDAGRTFSVSPAVKQLIVKMSDDMEEKLSSTHLQKLSAQLRLLSKLIDKNRPSLEFDFKAEEGISALEDSVEFLETRLVDLEGYRDEFGMSGDELALSLVASEIGAKKVTVTESKRKRIIYRGKK